MPAGGRFEKRFPWENSPDDGRHAGGGPDGDELEWDRSTGGMEAGPGQDGAARCGVSPGGHDGVSWPWPGHRAPTVSVDAPISFTYHLPL